MVKSLLIAVNKKLACDDLGKLLLRLAVGGLMLFHGLHKLFGGVGFISGMLVEKGLPGFIAYGVFVGEGVATGLPAELALQPDIAAEQRQDTGEKIADDRTRAHGQATHHAEILQMRIAIA